MPGLFLTSRIAYDSWSIPSVFLTVGHSGQFWLNTLFRILGYVADVVHAVWIMARR